MARKPRVHFPGALYHVIVRGNKGQKVFRDDSDYHLYLRLLSDYKDRYGFLLHAYILMPTHVHLLIEVGEVPLSRMMQSLQFRYTRNYNLRHQSWGHLFQGRYKAIMCEKDSYFLELSAYIHLNPVRSGFVKEPAQYKWSSYRCYLKEGKGCPVDTDFLLVQFSNQKSTARREYDLFTRARINQGYRNDFYELRDQRFLGSDEFVENIHRNLKEKYSLIYDLSIQEAISVVSLALKVPTDLFYSVTRNRQGAWGRAVVGYLVRRFGGYSIREIAEYFQRDPVVVSQGVRRVEQRLREDAMFSSTMTALQETLIHGKKQILI